MTNLCENYLTITPTCALGSIEKLLEALRGEDGKLSFETALPIPENIGEGWYEWCIENWGTKWNPVEDTGDIEVKDDGSVSSFLLTAWDPPTAWLTTLAERFPGYVFEIEYMETGNAISGKVTAESSRIIEEIDETATDMLRRRMSMGKSSLAYIIEETLDDACGLETYLDDENLPSDVVTEIDKQLRNGDPYLLSEDEVRDLLTMVEAHPNFAGQPA